MDTDTQESAIVRRRRWPWVTAVAVVVVVAGWVAAASFHPGPQAGSAFGVTRGAHRTISDPPTENRGGELLEYRDREEAEYLFAVRNPGPLPMTITEIELRKNEEGDAFLTEQVVARLAFPNDPFAEGGSTPFAPFRLGSGEERTVLMRIRFENCEEQWLTSPAEEAQGLETDTGRFTHFWESEGLSFRILGFERTTRITLPGSVGVQSPPRSECPGAP